MKLVSITITRGEGPSDLCGVPKEFKTFKEANDWIISQQDTYPRLGYDKHDFTIVFDKEDWDYTGRIDLKHPENKRYSPRDNDVYCHVIDFLTYLTTDARAAKAFGLNAESIAETKVYIAEFEQCYQDEIKGQ